MPDKSGALWLVAENMPGKYDPREATLLCVVRADSGEAEQRLEDVLRRHSMIAYKETYGQYFQREGWTKRKPVSVRQFAETIQAYSPFDTDGLRRAFRAMS